MGKFVFDQAIDKLVEVVDWREGGEEGYVDTPASKAAINVVNLLYPESEHLVESALHARIEERKQEPDPDAELIDHLVYEEQLENLRETP